MYETAFGNLPFTGSNVYEITRTIHDQKVEITESASGALRELLNKMLCVNPAERLTLKEVRAHRFFKQKMTMIEARARIPPRVHRPASTTDIKVVVCDENYGFASTGKSSSWSGFYGQSQGVV
jgi:protein kinase